MVRDKSDGLYKPLDLTRTYRVAANEFLAPAGGDGFQAFQNMTNITYCGDMLNLVNAWLMSAYPLVSPYNGTLDGRIAWDGVDAGVIPGQAHAPIDGLKVFTEETNAANMQADAAVDKLLHEEIDVDFNLAGAVRNMRIAEGAAPATPYDLTARELYTLIPYDYNIVVLSMNGPQIKAILERAFRNYHYYKYVPGYGGYQYYTTGMLDISSGCEITYLDDFPAAYNRNAVIEYVDLQETVLPAIESRLVFLNELPEPTPTPTPEPTP